MLLHIKREHRALTQVSDEEELFLQLSSTGHANGGAEHQASDTAFHNNNSNMEHTLKPNSLLEVRPVVIAPTSRVDAAAVSSILSHFDLRVAPPELFVSNSVPASPSSVSKRSSGGDHTPPPSAGHDASSMLRYDDFQDFLQQRGVTATATGGGANDPSRRSSTASNNLTRITCRGR
ncbi:Hypothetical protein, putative [Bodo saltans]|uniref:Uncharacterized protein n=1 Tax=Bodo saltans TaxID=75058 RepID=A0A0S4IVA5_BODSA|nr:Hypothetical protein, putative [Bodo saltans]|eukprot:CUG16957.1 Hypothetical protein, putative [Bodo saltans]